MTSEKPTTPSFRNRMRQNAAENDDEGSPSEEGDTRRMIVEDIHDLAKLGGDLFKRTVNSGIEAIKEVKEGLPKEASQLLSKGKEEMLKGISKEVLQNVLMSTVDRVFAKVKEHKLEVTIGIRLKSLDENAESAKAKKK